MPEEVSAMGVSQVANHLSDAVDKFLTPEPSPPSARDEEILSRGTRLKLEHGLAATYWGDGPTVLLAHGWNSRGTHFGAFITALVETGCRAVAVDAPAHGDSPGRQANVFQYGVGLLRIGRQLGPMVGVVGHSFGAGAAVIAVHNGLNVERVALISGPASLRAVVERWGRRHRLSESDIPTFVRLVEREVGQPFDALDIVQIAARLTHPVLVVHDRSDEAIPVDDGLAVASAWPGAKMLITERYGHGRILIAKEVVREVVTFLNGLAD
jgi:pimeloyl-ACP methyl ester carboxylesterase